MGKKSREKTFNNKKNNFIAVDFQKSTMNN